MPDKAQDKLFDLLRDIQKDLSQVEMTLTAHLEASDVRIEGWEEKFKEIKTSIDEHKDKLRELLFFKEKCLSEENAISKIKNTVAWLAGIVGVAAAIYFGMK